MIDTFYRGISKFVRANVSPATKASFHSKRIERSRQSKYSSDLNGYDRPLVEKVLEEKTEDNNFHELWQRDGSSFLFLKRLSKIKLSSPLNAVNT